MGLYPDYAVELLSAFKNPYRVRTACECVMQARVYVVCVCELVINLCF